jgi:hypothetical protein
MEELHENEQYFFTKEFENWFVGTIVNFFQGKKICCVCCPMIGARLVEAGMDVKILDIDRRFEKYEQFIYYDIKDPKYLDYEFDLIVCDPPFFNVSFTELLKAIKTLTHFTMYKSIFMTYLYRREIKFLDMFADYDLYRIKDRPQYKTLDVTDPKNDIRLYCNYLFPMDTVKKCEG